MYLTTTLGGAQYYHIPSIRNGDAASAARATYELCIRAVPPALPLSDSMLEYPLTCVELTCAHEEATVPTLHLRDSTKG